MNDRVLDWIYYKIRTRVENPERWYQRLSMIGFKSGRTYRNGKWDPLSYFGLMFFWFAVFWHNVHPEIQYGGGQPIPWHGFTLSWGPNATGEPGVKLWKHKKELLLWR